MIVRNIMEVWSGKYKGIRANDIYNGDAANFTRDYRISTGMARGKVQTSCHRILKFIHLQAGGVLSQIQTALFFAISCY